MKTQNTLTAEVTPNGVVKIFLPNGETMTIRAMVTNPGAVLINASGTIEYNAAYDKIGYLTVTA